MSQMNMPISGLCLGTPKNTDDAWRSFVCSQRLFKVRANLIRSFQLEELLSRMKISHLTCLIKEAGSQVASLDLLTASSECRSLPSCFQSVGSVQPLIWRLQFDISRKYSRFTPVMWSKLKIVSIQMNKVKNQGYDRWLIYKLPGQEPGLCSFFCSSVICRSVSPKFIELCMEMPRLCPEGHKHGGHYLSLSLLLKRKIAVALEIRHIEINVSFSASTV